MYAGAGKKLQGAGPGHSHAKWRNKFIKSFVIFRSPGFLFVFIVVISVANAFHEVFNQEDEVTMLFELLDMCEFVAYPFPVVYEFACCGVVEENCFAQDHSHFVLFQLFSCKAGEP